MNKKLYDHRAIEKKWQKHWEEEKTFQVNKDSSKPKYYVLDMFPYPSGAGLHVGHVEGYTATDILSRYKRMKGFNVLHPMGWDSFGLPAEQYAIRTGTHPAETTQKNINNFRRQLKSLGFCYDWDREFATSDPSYYKWTQWIFTKLYERGLAYEAKMFVNFCPKLGTVLSNEEVVDGKSVEGGHAVVRKALRQWVLKITAYAEKLIDDLEDLDWPESLKRLQRNWIGKSEGAEVHFKVDTHSEEIKIYTTRPDTLFGATYMVLAPEHPLVSKLTLDEHKKDVEDYCREAASKSDLDRTELQKDKIGVFTGSFAINPVNEEKIPIWVADYVLISYGTGAIMAVPAHDERDFAFAKQYALPIQPVYDMDLSHPEVCLEPEEDKKAIRDEVLAGHRAWPGEGSCINSAHGDLDLNGLNITEAKAKAIAWLEQNNRGKATINYKLRDWLFSRQRYWGEPFPILHFEDGSKRILELDELPLCPPEVTDFLPTPEGESPLSKVKEWIEITDPKTGKKAKRENNTMPQWAGSCWYYLRFCDPKNEKQAWGKENEAYWLPVDMYVGGVEHAVLHLLYARFWHKVLFDCGLVHTNEPFKTLRNPGLIVSRSYKDKENAYVAEEDVVERDGKYYHRETDEKLASQIEKMSKSKLNGVNPDEIVDECGADALRLYEMFMGPLEKEKIWNTRAVNGCRKFLSRFYNLVTSDHVSEEDHDEATRLAHRLAIKVEKDLEKLSFNTAIARMMEFVNDFSDLEHYPKSALLMATKALAPFAPHMAEECYEILGGEGELSFAKFPKGDPSYLEEQVITYIVQVNGKLRGRFDLPKDQDEETITAMAKEHHSVAKHLNGSIRKVVFVPNKLINFVVSE